MTEYRRGAHTVYEIHLHVVWTTKYRKPILAGEAATRVRDLIREICGSHDEGARVEGSCAPTGFNPAASNDQQAAAMAEGEDCTQNHVGVSAHQEALLGAAYVGPRVLLLQHGERDG